MTGTCRDLHLIGVNGEKIDLKTYPFFAADKLRFGAPEAALTIRDSIQGRRVDRRRHEVATAAFRVHILGNSPLELDENRRTFEAALNGQGGQRGTRVQLIHGRTDGYETALVGQSTNTAAPEIELLDACELTLPVIIEAIEEPYWTAVEAVEASTSIGVDSSTPWIGRTPYNQPIPYASPIAYTGYTILDAAAQVLPLVNDGDVHTWPTWTITGPFNSFSLENLTTGKVIQFTGPIGVADPFGQELQIITNEKHPNVIQSDNERWVDLTDVSDLWPLERGLNHVRVSVQGGTDGVTTVAVRWQTRHLTP